MSSEVDMSGFIPAVVAEEERRNEAHDGDEEDEDELEQLMPEDLDDSQLDDSPLGLYAYHTPGATRQAQMMNQQKRTRRMRQMEAIAPRHEILRNLPFFIPFETR